MYVTFLIAYFTFLTTELYELFEILKIVCQLYIDAYVRV